MIPPYIDTEVKSPGEKRIFQDLEYAPGTERWVACHSQQVPRHRKKLRGEADFVIIIPDLAVVVLEVKAHRSIAYRNKQWHMGQEGPVNRGPFEQAQEAMHSLKDDLVRHDPGLKRVPWVSIVAFTEVGRPAVDGQQPWKDGELIDAAMYERHGIATCIERAARAMFNELGRASLRDDDVEPVERFLAPTFRVLPPPIAVQGDLRRDLARAFGMQHAVLRAVDNPLLDPRQVVVAGPAGSGKTLLAREAVRTLAGEGKRVLFLMFNKFIAEHCASEVAKEGQGFPHSPRCSTIDALLTEIVGASVPDAASERKAFFQGLPERAVNAMFEQDFEPFDALVIDEAQDVLRERYIEALDYLVAGGLASGTWFAFGDFMNQAIYVDRGETGSIDLLRDRNIAAASSPVALFDNCRNPPPIGEMAALAGNLAPGYSKYLRESRAGGPPQFVTYGSLREAVTVLEDAIGDALESFGANDIVILGAAVKGALASSLGTRPGRPPIREYWKGPGAIRYTTIHSFKGLEAPVVLVTDIDKAPPANRRELLYVALTRAQHTAIVVISEDARHEIAELLSG